MTCVLLDDEPYCLKLLNEYLKDLPSLKILGSFTHPMEAIDFIQNNPSDLIIMDINMPQIDGISLAKAIDSRVMKIFTTAYSEFAVESYELDAVDYLLKPFDRERLIIALGKAYAKLNRMRTQRARSMDSVVILNDGKIKHFLNVGEIQYFEANGDYVNVHLKGKRKLTIYNSLKEIERDYPDIFLRIHNSFIISPGVISSFSRSNVVIDNKELPIGRTYVKHVSKFFEPAN